MTNTLTHKPTNHIQLLLAGSTGGVVGGVFFGFLMFMQGMLPMVAQLVRSDSLIVGGLVHMSISIIFGTLFGLIIERLQTTLLESATLGLLYGIFWWIIGALILMPIFLGATPQLSAALSTSNLWSLVGHLFYGLFTGLTVAFMTLSKDLEFWS
jgi:uncharacterized membrane protein YagU involved in acid resistance